MASAFHGNVLLANFPCAMRCGLPPDPMTLLRTASDVIDELAREPLRHIVLLKQLLAYPAHVKVHRISGAAGTATLIALDTSVSPYDRQAYPEAAVAAFISSDHPELTASLMSHLPHGIGIVFKLSSEADLTAVESQFPVTRRTAFVSFTSAGGYRPAAGLQVTSDPSDAAFRMFETQGHGRTWLKPLLYGGKAFACVLECDGEAAAACLAYENYGAI